MSDQRINESAARLPSAAGKRDTTPVKALRSSCTPRSVSAINPLTMVGQSLSIAQYAGSPANWRHTCSPFRKAIARSTTRQARYDLRSAGQMQHDTQTHRRSAHPFCHAALLHAPAPKCNGSDIRSARGNCVQAFPGLLGRPKSRRILLWALAATNRCNNTLQALPAWLQQPQ